MRIALVSTPFVAVPPPGYGGTELVVHALWKAFARAGHQVTVYATGDSAVPGVRALFEQAVWPPDPYTDLLHGRFAARDALTRGYDVVHVHSPAALAFADAYEAPVVYTIHHDRDPVLSRFYARAPRAIHVAISRRQAALQDPPPDFVVHHGLDPELYPATAVTGSGDVAFFLGRASWCKGPDVAIEAARRAGLPIVVAGAVHEEDEAPAGWLDGVLRPRLALPHVRWVPHADLAMKRRLFARARALLVPIRWEEPFGLVMIEAMLAGCPVIAFPRGAAPEIVEDGVTGFLVDDLVGMARALRHARRIDRAACRARAIERFSNDRMARDYLAIYRAAIAGGRSVVHGAGAGTGDGDDGWTKLAT